MTYVDYDSREGEALNDAQAALENAEFEAQQLRGDLKIVTEDRDLLRTRLVDVRARLRLMVDAPLPTMNNAQWRDALRAILEENEIT